jgi:hypothetical protein
MYVYVYIYIYVYVYIYIYIYIYIYVYIYAELTRYQSLGSENDNLQRSMRKMSTDHDAVNRQVVCVCVCVCTYIHTNRRVEPDPLNLTLLTFLIFKYGAFAETH